jgi:TRAP-type C4-dicarboxylate transport system substrate-binding protein
MKKVTIMLTVAWVSLIVAALWLPSAATCAEPIVLKWVSFTPKNSHETSMLQKYFFDRVNERAKGELVIQYRGGPEAIAGVSLGAAVHKGVVDICQIIIGFYEAIVPGVNALMLTELTPQEERMRGAHDFIVKLHQEHGLMFLGRASPSKERFFYTFLNKRVETPQDFTRLRLGAGPAARAAALAWGAQVIPAKDTGEYYTAIERGLYDGLSSTPLAMYVGLGCHEVTKYAIDHPYYKSTVVTIMNLNSWNRLPKHLQELVNEVMIEYAPIAMEEHTQRTAADRKKAEAAKMEFYKFKPEVEDWFLNTAYKAAWDYQQERFPEVTPKLRKVLSK